VNPEPSPTGADDGARRPGMRYRRAAVPACYIILVAVKIWLVLAFGMRAAGNAQADDRLFVALAEHILHGDWLGPYDRFTLVKGPFFSIWIAAAFLAHVPLTLSYQLLHIAACGLLLVALRPIVPSGVGRLALFAVLLFDPSTYSAMASWVIRDAIYMPMTIVILACVVALLTRLHGSPRHLVAWSVGLGVVLAAYWTTREEGVWIVPGAGVALLFALVSVWRARTAAVAKSAVLLLPAALCAAGVFGVCALNQRHYGVFTVVDMKSPGFTQANGALMRVHHENWNQFASVPQEVRLKIYAVSPAFAELRGFLEGPPGVAWGHGGEVWLSGGTPSPVDIRGGFFVFALREAVAQRGYYRSAPEAEAYYARLAAEINAACADGRLSCGPERASLTPPWRPEYTALAARSAWKGLRMMATFGDVTVFNMPSAGPEDMMIIFEDLGRTRINPLMGDTSAPRLRNQAQLDQIRFDHLNRLNAAYKFVAPYLTVLACAAFLAGCVLEVRARTLSPALVMMAVLLVSFAARIAILTIISIASFEAMKLRYFLPLYPMLLLFWFLSIQHAVRLAVAAVRGRSAPAASIPPGAL